MYIIYLYKICMRPLSVQAENSRSFSILSSSGYDGSLVTLTVICLTAEKFKPLIFSVWGFVLSSIVNISIFVICITSDS
jgi:hypothetical protein